MMRRMRRMVYTRPFDGGNKRERRLFIEWLHARRAENRYDPDLFTKNQVRILTCFDSGGILGFVPVATCYVLESLAFAPGTAPETEARCLEAVQHHLVHTSVAQQVPYMYLATTDQNVIRLTEHRGWKQTEVPVLCFDFNRLEPRVEDIDGGS